MIGARMFTALAACAGGQAAMAGITLDIRPSAAPNMYGSASWSGYAANALQSLRNGGGNIGDRSVDPSAYAVSSSISAGDIMASNFGSWCGSTGSATGAFAGERGNRLHFGLHAYGDGTTQFRLSDISFSIDSNDSGNSMRVRGDFSGLGYDETRIGINWGADRTAGTHDDIVFTSGNGNTLVDEIVYVGAGSSLWPQTLGNQTCQSALQDVMAGVMGAPETFTVSARYTVAGFQGQAHAVVVPLPKAALLGFVGLGGLAWWRTRPGSRL